MSNAFSSREVYVATRISPTTSRAASRTKRLSKMQAPGPHGGGPGDPHPSPVQMPPPPQVLFFGEFTRRLAPGQQAKEGGEVDEVTNNFDLYIMYTMDVSVSRNA